MNTAIDKSIYGQIKTKGEQLAELVKMAEDIQNNNDKNVAEAYQRGLDDAWECARELYLNGACKDLFGEYFNTFIKNHTAQEAIEKLKAYEEKQNDKIEVGDTVNLKDAISNKGDGIVTRICNNDYCYIVWYDGSGGAWEKDKLVKTGKHIDIASILKEMNDEP